MLPANKEVNGKSQATIMTRDCAAAILVSIANVRVSSSSAPTTSIENSNLAIGLDLDELKATKNAASQLSANTNTNARESLSLLLPSPVPVQSSNIAPTAPMYHGPLPPKPQMAPIAPMISASKPPVKTVGLTTFPVGPIIFPATKFANGTVAVTTKLPHLITLTIFNSSTSDPEKIIITTKRPHERIILEKISLDSMFVENQLKVRWPAGSYAINGETIKDRGLMAIFTVEGEPGLKAGHSGWRAGVLVRIFNGLLKELA